MSRRCKPLETSLSTANTQEIQSVKQIKDLNVHPHSVLKFCIPFAIQRYILEGNDPNSSCDMVIKILYQFIKNENILRGQKLELLNVVKVLPLEALTTAVQPLISCQTSDDFTNIFNMFKNMCSKLLELELGVNMGMLVAFLYHNSPHE